MYWSTGSKFVLPVLLCTCAAMRGEEAPTLGSNLKYRLGFGDLGDASEIPGYAESKRALPITFGRTSEVDVYRSLVQDNPDRANAVPPPRYDFGKHAKQYLKNSFGTQAIGLAIATGAADAALHGVTGWGSGRYSEQLATNLARHTLSESIEFGTAALLQQDQTFVQSQEHGFRRRSRAALYHALFVPGRDGDELAFPRLTAALATPWAMQGFHPGYTTARDPWMQSAVLFGSYFLRSFWAEFRPEITRTLHKAFRTTQP
jgi:hypothetical protein